MELIKFHRLPVLTLFVVLLSVTAAGQTLQVTPETTEIIQDSRVDQLVEKHVRINQSLKTSEGFRIQLFSDSGNNSKNRAQALQEELIGKFPDIGVYLSFKSPNYRIRLGNFRSRLDAQRFLNDIAVEYPNAFIVNDMISLPKTPSSNP